MKQAEEANETSIESTDRTLKQERELADLQRRLKSPRLRLDRMTSLSPDIYVATVQNEGERQLAIYEVYIEEQSVMEAGPAVANSVPVENRIPVVSIKFDESSPLHAVLATPVIVHPGQIVNLKIHLASAVTEGDMFLDTSGGSVGLGRFVQKRISHQTPVDDIFGEPDAPAPVDDIFAPNDLDAQ